MKRSKSIHKFAALMTAAVLTGQAGAAFAQGSGSSMATVITDISTNAQQAPRLISTVAYISGVALGVAGIHKLKQHVDQPSQHPMKDGLIRLGAGGGLIALPWLTNVMTNTVGNDGTAAQTMTNSAFDIQ